MRKMMNAAIATFVTFITLFIIVETGAQQPDVVLERKFAVAPFVMPSGTKLPGDRVCGYFFLTYYGNPAGTAFIVFNHIEEKNVTTSEALRQDNVTIVKENIAQPYVTFVQNNNPAKWTIHIGQSDLDGSEAKCLAGIPVR